MYGNCSTESPFTTEFNKIAPKRPVFSPSFTTPPTAPDST